MSPWTTNIWRIRGVTSRLAVLETALRARKLDRTLDDGAAAARTIRPCRVHPVRHRTPSTRCCGGGLPRGQVSELAGPHSSGRTTLLLHLLGAATRGGEIAALIDTCDRLDVASASAAGIDLDRLLWIRGAVERIA